MTYGHVSPNPHGLLKQVRVAGESCAQVRDKLLAHMDDNDRIFVATLTGTAAWRDVLCESEYLKKNL